MERLGMACKAKTWHIKARQGMACQGKEGHGMSRQGNDMPIQGKACHGKVFQGKELRHVKARYDMERKGMA
jgi:hypothetical protein